MTVRAAARAALVVVVAASACGEGTHAPAAHARQQAPATSTETAISDANPTGRGFAYEVVELASGRIVAAANSEVLDDEIAPGSVAKVVALLAASEAGVWQEATATACPRRLVVEGHEVDCVHPDLGHPLTAVDALAHSCNGFFAGLGRHVPRAAFDRVLIGAGLPPTAAGTPLVLSVLGLEGVRASARRWRDAFVALVQRAQAAPDAPVHRALLAGLAGAGAEGTGAAFGRRGLPALVKTGTATLGGGQPGGMVVAVWPADHPTHAVVGLAAGAAGRDAAELVAMALTEPPRAAEAPPRDGRSSVYVRVGRGGGGSPQVESIELERYVAAVVAAEAGPAAPPAARRALAVLARSFALAHWGRHGRDGFDVCDTTHCQVLAPVTGDAEAAAHATSGRVLADGEDVARAYYSASCGGALADAAEVWPSGADGLGPRARTSRGGGVVGVDPVPHDVESWTAELSAEQLTEVARQLGPPVDRMRGLSVVTRSSSGRVLTLRVDGAGEWLLDAESFRLAVGRRFGWHLLKSSHYTLSPTSRGVRFEGRGKGHGVGFCLAGATALANRGGDHEALLTTYFPRFYTVSLTQPAQVSVMLPAARAADRARVLARLEAMVSTLKARLGVTTTRSIRLRVHPTPASFARASGQPWWASAATRAAEEGAVIDMVPLETLERRGGVDATLAHELVHALTATALADRPLWVREGLAVHLAGEPRAEAAARAHSTSTRGSTCLPDDAFDAARGAEALSQAYATAGACVHEALAAGLDWRDLGTGPSRR